jgi:MerR family transcriptional regulator, light-induced transcriptional regulator
MPDGKYTVNEVEERTGVPATTLRQWERRYGVPKPERSHSGYRLYSDADLRDIRTIKRHVDDGVPASRAAEMARRTPATEGTGPRPLDELRRELVAALVALDEPTADRVLAEAHALHGVDEVVLDLMHNTMVDIGTLWHDGTIATTTEHFASAYLHGRLRQIMMFSGVDRSGPAVIVACAPLDQHDIGAMMLAVMLRRSGFQVYYLGANTPVEDLAGMASHVHPAAVLISASSVDAVQQLLRQRESLRGIAPVLGFGGNGFNADPRRAELAGGVFLADNIGDAVSRLHALVAAHRPGASA